MSFSALFLEKGCLENIILICKFLYYIFFFLTKINLKDIITTTLSAWRQILEENNSDKEEVQNIPQM